jgi:hypothetical protein
MECLQNLKKPMGKINEDLTKMISDRNNYKVW